jgi:hypothetical protein
MTPLMALRALPLAVRHPRERGAKVVEGFRHAGSRPLLDQFLAAGFAELADAPPAGFAAGGIGRFWTLSSSAPIEFAGARGFADFAEPGYAKAAFSITIEPSARGATVSTETRVVTTSPDAHRAFGRYWRLIAPASALIRRSWLAGIRRRAER